MSKYWVIDSPLMNGLGKIGDIMILNILFVISCIPVVTIGAALSSLYSVAMKLARNENPTVTRAYFKAFKENFKVGTICWLILLAVGALCWVDFRAIGNFGGSIKTISRVLMGAVLVVYVMVFTWLFPYIGRFSNTVLNSFKNAFAMGVIHFPFTLLLGGMAVGIMVIVFFTSRTFVIATILGAFFGFAAFAYVQSMILQKIFAKYE